MKPLQYRDLITRAKLERSVRTMDKIIAQLLHAEYAREIEILRAKGYGQSGMSASTTAAQVPNRHQ